MDCHGAGGGYKFNSLIAEDLDPACEFVVQERWTGYTAFLESGCDAALFVGMHAMAGTALGVLNHTVLGHRVAQPLLQRRRGRRDRDQRGALRALGLPGRARHRRHRDVRRGHAALLGDGLTTVAVKDGTGRFGARNLAPKRARELIEEGARKALGDLSAVPPYDPGRPCEIRVVFHHTDGVDRQRANDRVEITGPREIVSRADDWWSAWRQFFFSS